MHKLKSSNLDFCKYDAESKTLEVGFLSGGHYKYLNVDQSTFDKFLNAKSHGTFFAKEIKGKFKDQKVDKKKENQNGKS